MVGGTGYRVKVYRNADAITHAVGEGLYCYQPQLARL